jgi:hypothetical protein
MENKVGAVVIGSTDNVAEADFRKREEALREYYHTQDLIDRFDERSLKIKSWSVTSCGVALAFGVTEHQPFLFCLAAIGSLVFWYLEVLWKVMQGMMIERSNDLETQLSQPSLTYDGPKIGHTFISGFRGDGYWRRFRKTTHYPNVRVPHILIFIVGGALFIASLLGFKL